MKVFTPLQRFWRLLAVDKKDIGNLYFYAVISGVVSLSLPLGVQAIINLIQGGEISTAWVVMVVFVIGGIAITGILQIFQLRIVENIRQKIFARSSFEFAYRFPRMQMQALYDHYYPELANRFFDTITLQKALPKILIDFSIASLQIIIGLILLTFYHPFFLVFGLILLILIFLIFKFSGPSGLRTSLQESKLKYKMAHWLEEVARALTVFKLTGQHEYALSRTDDYLNEYLHYREGHFRVLLRQFVQFVGFKVLVAAGLLVIGSILVFNEEMNIGQFVAAEIIILIIINSVEKLILVLENIYDILTSLEKIAQVTDQPLERNGGVHLEDNSDGMTLSFAAADFSYPEDERKVINKMDLEIKAGEHIFLTGSNGSGKSTLIRLMAGLYDIEVGQYTVDGWAVSSLDLPSFRSKIGCSIASTVLFKGTIEDNLKVGRSGLTLKDVMWALEMVDLKSWLSQQPLAHLTMIDPEESRLPRSVTQKLLLARAIIGKPRLLLLEDPLQFVDAVSKKRIINNILASGHKWTVVTASMDFQWVLPDSRVLWMNDGRVEYDYDAKSFFSSTQYQSFIDVEHIS